LGTPCKTEAMTRDGGGIPHLPAQEVCGVSAKSHEPDTCQALCQADAGSPVRLRHSAHSVGYARTVKREEQVCAYFCNRWKEGYRQNIEGI